MNEEKEWMIKEEHIKDLLHSTRINEFRDTFLDLHVYDQSQFYLSLDKEDRLVLYGLLSPKEMGDMFDTIEEDHEQIPDFLEEMDPKYAAEMLSEMYTDNATDLLDRLSKEEVTKYLKLLTPEDALEMKTLLHYEDSTAGSIMATEYIAIVANQTVRSAMSYLKKEASEAETIYYVYVVDSDESLVGVISLRDLILNDDDVMISEIMNTGVISVTVDEDQEDVAHLIQDYNFLAVPVVDGKRRLIGIITVDDIIDVLDEEAAQDYSGLAGVNVDDIQDNPFKSAFKRLPWLIALLFLSMGTASLISHFDGMIAEASVLAVFITSITGTAGNAGTQSLAVAIRRLSLNEDDQPTFWQLIIREIITGLFTGLITGLSIMIVVGVWKQSFILGGVIGIAMMCAITVANLAGSLIPLLMDKLGFDPAVASGPFISTLSDLTSVLIYFNIAGIFMHYFLAMN